jgi:hypothetical protein
LPQAWLDQQLQLQIRILSCMRDLGMTPGMLLPDEAPVSFLHHTFSYRSCCLKPHGDSINMSLAIGDSYISLYICMVRS